jgi:hypothetical protein
MSVELCDNCPVLRTAAEEERLLQAGIMREGWNLMEALVVGRLRREYGCRGPNRYGVCRWHRGGPGTLQVRQDVPLLDGNASRDPGPYL